MSKNPMKVLNDNITSGDRTSALFPGRAAGIPGSRNRERAVSCFQYCWLWLVAALLAPAVTGANAPVLQWSTYLGGSDNENAYGIATDAARNIYVTGDTRSQGWVHGGGATTLAGARDAFVAKFAPDGSPIWSTYWGGPGEDYAIGIVVDSAGNAFISGFTDMFSGRHAFVAKIDASGVSKWVTDITPGYGYGICIDKENNLVVAGNRNGQAQPFVAKVGPSGNVIWLVNVGGSVNDYAVGVAIDSANNIITCGHSQSPGWTSGGFDTSFNGELDAFVVKLDPSGQHIWSTFLGGTGSDYGCAVTVDQADNIVVAGTSNAGGWVSGGFDTSWGGNADDYVAKLSAAGDHLWSTFLGGSYEDGLCGPSTLAINPSGEILFGGWTASPDWVSGGFDTSYNGENDAVVVKLSANGKHIWSTYLGGAQETRGSGVAVDSTGDIILFGYTSAPDWVSGGSDTTFGGGFDAFVAKIKDATVVDATPPVITCPTDLTVSTDPGACSATSVILGTASAADNCGVASVVSDAPTVFPKGMTCVTWTATDTSGNTATCVQRITVVDKEAPAIVCPVDISLPCSPDLFLSVTFSVTVSDNCDAQPTVACVPPSGSGFPVGSTVVTCTARDEGGNISSCTFKVIRAPLEFSGFLPPLSGADATGGSFLSPLRTFKLGTTIPVKFTAACGGAPLITGNHRLQVVKYSDATTAGDPIDASPRDAATSGNQFRLADSIWHFNLDTQATGMSKGIWLVTATLSDGSQHRAWIQLK